jgi:hypothetical protein
LLAVKANPNPATAMMHLFIDRSCVLIVSLDLDPSQGSR